MQKLLVSLALCAYVSGAAFAQDYDAEGKKYYRTISKTEYALFDKAGANKFIYDKIASYGEELPLWARITPVILPIHLSEGGCFSDLSSGDEKIRFYPRESFHREYDFFSVTLAYKDLSAKTLPVTLSTYKDKRKLAVEALKQAFDDCKAVAGDEERPVFFISGLIRQSVSADGCDPSLYGKYAKCEGIVYEYGPVHFEVRSAVFSGLSAKDFEDEKFEVWNTEIFKKMVSLDLFKWAK